MMNGNTAADCSITSMRQAWYLCPARKRTPHTAVGAFSAIVHYICRYTRSMRSITMFHPASEMTRTTTRLAQAVDIPELQRIIEQSVVGLLRNDYTERQIESALQHL